MMDKENNQQLTNFELFVLGVSILSLLNIFLVVILPLSEPVTNVVLVVDGLLCLILMGNFLLQLKRAPDKRAYFLHDKGWLDLLGSLPFPGLRLALLFRIVRSSRAAEHSGIRGIWRMFNADRAGSALLSTLFLAIIILQFGSMFILGAEADQENTNIKTASDALWWSYATVTTVGYGDRFPVTNQGRVVGVAMLTIGVGLFGVLTGFVTNVFLGSRRGQKDQDTDDTSDIHEELEELKQLVRELGERMTERDQQ